MNKGCKYCNITEQINDKTPALYFANKPISSCCCSNGHVILDLLQLIPELRHRIVQVEFVSEYLDEIGNRLVEG